MSVLIAYYFRVGENYFGGAYRNISVGNTEKAAKMISEITGGKLFRIEQEILYSDVYQTCIAEAGGGKLTVAPGKVILPFDAA